MNGFTTTPCRGYDRLFSNTCTDGMDVPSSLTKKKVEIDNTLMVNRLNHHTILLTILPSFVIMFSSFLRREDPEGFKITKYFQFIVKLSRTKRKWRWPNATFLLLGYYLFRVLYNIWPGNFIVNVPSGPKQLIFLKKIYFLVLLDNFGFRETFSRFHLPRPFDRGRLRVASAEVPSRTRLDSRVEFDRDTIDFWSEDFGRATGRSVCVGAALRARPGVVGDGGWTVAAGRCRTNATDDETR